MNMKLGIPFLLGTFLTFTACHGVAPYSVKTIELPYQVIHSDPLVTSPLKQMLLGGFQPAALVIAGEKDEVEEIASLNKELLATFGEYEKSRTREVSEKLAQISAQLASRIDNASSKSKVKITSDLGFRGPDAFGDPQFATAFYSTFDIRSVTIGVESFRLTYPDEDEMEPFFHIGYQTSKKTFMDISGKPYEHVRNQTIVDADQSRFMQLDGKEDITLLLRFYEDDGEFLRTETQRFLSELQQQAKAGLVLQTSSERIASLQAGVLDWVPIVNWVIEVGMWAWSWVSRSDELTPSWQIPLVRDALFTPQRQNGNLIKKMVVFDARGTELTLEKEAPIAALLLAMQKGVRLVVTIESINVNCSVTYNIDILYFKK